VLTCVLRGIVLVTAPYVRRLRTPEVTPSGERR
jgi:hypothetical protein